MDEAEVTVSVSQHQDSKKKGSQDHQTTLQVQTADSSWPSWMLWVLLAVGCVCPPCWWAGAIMGCRRGQSNEFLIKAQRSLSAAARSAWLGCVCMSVLSAVVLTLVLPIYFTQQRSPAPPTHYLAFSGPSNVLPVLDNHKLSILQRAIHTALNLSAGTYPDTSITVWPVAQPALLRSRSTRSTRGPTSSSTNNAIVLVGFVLAQPGLTISQDAVAHQLQDPGVMDTMASSLAQLGFIDPSNAGLVSVSYTEDQVLINDIMRDATAEPVLMQQQQHASIIGQQPSGASSTSALGTLTPPVASSSSAPSNPSNNSSSVNGSQPAPPVSSGSTNNGSSVNGSQPAPPVSSGSSNNTSSINGSQPAPPVAPTQPNSPVCNITKVAGTGVSGYSGDGGPALAAMLAAPAGVSCDQQGNLLIADASGRVVRKIDLASGNITTVIGTWQALASYTNGVPATGGLLSTVRGAYKAVADAAGNIYVVDFSNSLVRRVDAASNTISTIAGVPAAVGFTGDGGLAVNASLTYPTDVVVDSAGNVYIADSGNDRVRKVDTAGIITTVAGNGATGPVADDGQPALSAAISPTGLAVDPTTGLLYISESINCRVRFIAANGTMHTAVGNAGGVCGTISTGVPATHALLNQPCHISFDPTGNLFIADRRNVAVRRVSALTGIITTIASRYSPQATGVWGPELPLVANPYGVALCPSGPPVAYVGDSLGHVAYKIEC